MLKNIATARSGCTTKDKNMASLNTDYTVPDSTDFFGNDLKAI